MKENNLIELINEIKNISEKLGDSNIDIDESIKLFEEGTKKISDAQLQLETLKGKVKKVIDESNTEDF